MKLKRIPAAFLILALVSALMLMPSLSAQATPRSAIRDARIEYEERVQPLFEALGVLQKAKRDRLTAVAGERESKLALQAARKRLEDDRSRLSALAVHAYMDRGARGDDAEGGSQVGVALASARLRSDERELRSAQSAANAAQAEVREAEESVDRATREVTKFEESVADFSLALDEAIAPFAPTLPGAAYSAYLRASSAVHSSDPDCDVPAALLVGIGRIMGNHGRSSSSTLSIAGVSSSPLQGLIGSAVSDQDGGAIDGLTTADLRVGPLQILPSQWIEFDPQDQIASSPNWIYSSAIVAARVLCSSESDLSKDDGLRRALNLFTANPSLSQAILGSARQAARATDLDLGSIPADARVQSALDRLETAQLSGDSNESTIAALVAWSQMRLGTPYSQCLGADARPEDPECPPGTNRFGNGFFDCSGFVSAAYAAIGVSLPTTTDAMLLDTAFNDHKIGDQYLSDSDRAGDILLMDGHVALSLGEGQIIHASGGQLTQEPLPNWVRNGVLGVFRLLP